MKRTSMRFEKQKSESMITDPLTATRSAMFCAEGKDKGVWKQSFHPKSVFPTCVEHLKKKLLQILISKGGILLAGLVR
jgi:hypothetical protein